MHPYNTVLQSRLSDVLSRQLFLPPSADAVRADVAVLKASRGDRCYTIARIRSLSAVPAESPMP